MPVLLGLLAGFGLLLLLSKTGGPKLDASLPKNTHTAVMFAFFFEKDPQKLRAFAKALLPTYPLAAQALNTKATNLSKNVSLVAAKSLPAPGAVPTASPPKGISQTRASGSPHVSTGNVFDLDNYTDAAGKVVSTSVDVITHPADTASGAWHIITHPSDSISDFGNALVDALHAIPGMNEAGELLKDFAKTEFGTWCLRILATFGYYVLSPYLGAQLAAIAFAVPGVAKAEPFTQAWISETIDRTIKTINILLGTNIKKVTQGYEEQVEKQLAENPQVQALAKKFSEEIGQGSKAITDQLGFFADKTVAGIQTKLKDTYGSPPDFAKLAKDAGGIREDNAAAAFDLLAKTHYQSSTQWDPYTGEDIVAHLAKARLQTADKLNPQASFSVYQDPRTLSAPQLSVKRVQSLNALLNPPERQKWVDYYLNQARYADAGVHAKGSTPSSAPHTATGARPSEGVLVTMLAPGYYRAELASPYARDLLQGGGFGAQAISTSRVARVLQRQGIEMLDTKLLRDRLYLYFRTPYFVRLRNLPHVQWTNIRKVG